MNDRYVLIVEDSFTLMKTLGRRIKEKIKLDVLCASNFEESVDMVDSYHNLIEVALIDLNLPDAPNGEIVDFVTSFNIPTIVLTGIIDDKLKNKIIEKDIIDYVVKEDIQSIEYAISLLKRILNNKTTKVLAVDDSKTFLYFLETLLKKQNLQVFSAKDGVQALTILEEHPDIKLVLTDYYMPNMDGLELTKQIRKRWQKDEMGIIILSSADDKNIPSKFLKLGANDFLYKPYTIEEFNTRVNSNLEIIELFKLNKDRADKDFLTGIYNRRYFMEFSKTMISNAKRKNMNIVVAMVDIDFFKKINDTYGHDSGDEAIKFLARTLEDSLRDSDIVARLGGEEFAIILVNCAYDNIFNKFDEIRIKVEHNILKCYGHEIRFTISIGVMCELRNSIEEMLSEADRMLYESKHNGRNRVTIYSK